MRATAIVGVLVLLAGTAWAQGPEGDVPAGGGAPTAAAEAGLVTADTPPEAPPAGGGIVIRPRLTVEDVEARLAEGASFPDHDLSGLSLPGRTFAGLDLARTGWERADLRGARFARCTLDGADFSGALLSGALFEACSLREVQFLNATLAGASFAQCDASSVGFAGADLSGAAFSDVRFVRSGATYLPALSIALQSQGEPPRSQAFVSALCGNAFAFTYDPRARGTWPGRPLTVNPLTHACEVLGHRAVKRFDLRSGSGATEALSGALARGLTALIPMEVGGRGLRGDSVRGGLWVAVNAEPSPVAGQLPSVRVGSLFGVDVPYTPDDLASRWQGPWDTLEPLGALPARAAYPFVVVGVRLQQTAEREVVAEVLRTASRIFEEERTFGGVTGGRAAYEALSRDLNNPEVDVREVAVWSGFPRQCLIGTRRDAVEFLREAGAVLGPQGAAHLQAAGAEYETVVGMLEQGWPLPTPGAPAEGAADEALAAQADRYQAATVVLEVMDRERRAVDHFRQALVAEGLGQP